MQTNNHSATTTQIHTGGAAPIPPEVHQGTGGEEHIVDLQFFPTPRSLALKAWRKFQNHNFTRVLEPSAGTGDLAEADPYHRGKIPIDCCEIDLSKHAVLRDKGFPVVGLDFLNIESGSAYSHIIANPPFRDGVKHLLKAWEILWDGEIVFILNAESVKNPHSQERRIAVQLIEQHGSVEYIEAAFESPDTKRKTSVAIALVYLRKVADVRGDIFGNLLDDLQRDTATPETLGADFKPEQAVALPASVIENMVLAFNAAVSSMHDSVKSTARASYYASLIGQTMAVRNGDKGGDGGAHDGIVEGIQRSLGKQYEELKDRAWSAVLRSSNVTDRLSSAAQRRVESEFALIKKLQFTTANIYGFLCGIVESQGNMQIAMVCDAFDLITKYHADNTVFYKGWKSNSKHRTCGMQIKQTRFVLPYFRTQSYSSSLSWENQQTLRDFDKVFAMLDGGKREPAYGLVQAFNDHFDELRNGGRVSSSYFDIRHYPGVQTLHFFPRDKKLIDRLNRLVGRHRQWLPPEGQRVNDAFWLQYDTAPKFDKEFRQEVAGRRRDRWSDPLREYFNGDADHQANAQLILDDAMSAVLEQHGINTDFALENTAQEPLLLTAA